MYSRAIHQDLNKDKVCKNKKCLTIGIIIQKYDNQRLIVKAEIRLLR